MIRARVWGRAFARVGAAAVLAAMFAPVALGDQVSTVPGTGSLQAVACSTSSSCVAVGYGPQGGSADYGVVVPITNGNAGTVRPVSGGSNLWGVGCIQAGNCTGVGFNDQVSAMNSGAVLVPIASGTIGSITAQPVSGAAELHGASCFDTSCWAVGLTNLGGTSNPGVVLPITNPPSAAMDVFAATSLVGIGCVSATTCWAVGGKGLPAPGHGVVVPIVNGSVGAPVAVGGVGLNGVACWTAADCVAVGGGPPASTGVIVPITNGVVGSPVPIPGTSKLQAVTCPTSLFCQAVGFSSAGNGAVVSIVSGGVTAARTEPGTGLLLGVACPSPTSCIASGTQSSGTGVLVTYTPALSGLWLAKKAALADLPVAFKNAITYCTPAVIGALTFGTGVLLIGSAGPLAIAGALTVAATQPFCLATIKRLATDYQIYKDPPAREYRRLANPSPPAAVRLPSCKQASRALHSFCAQLSAAERSWVLAAERVASINQAVETTVARESRALAAGDQAAVDLQDGHIPGLEQQEQKALSAQASAGKSIARLLQAHRIGYRMTKSQSSQIIHAVERELARRGISAAQLKAVLGAGALRPRAINILAALARPAARSKSAPARDSGTSAFQFAGRS